MKIRELSEAEFSKFIRKKPSNNFLQSIEMFQRYKDIGREAYLFGGFVGKELKIAGLAFCMRDFMGWKVFNMARGPILDFGDKRSFNYQGEFLDECAKFLEDRGGAVLQISPNFYRKTLDADFSEDVIPKWKERERFDSLFSKIGFKYLGEFAQIKWAYFKDLTEGEEAVLKSFRQGARRSIKYARERYGMKLRTIEESELPKIEKLVNETGRRHGFVGPDVAYYASMKKHFADKVTFVAVATEDENVATASKMENDVARDGGNNEFAAVGMFIEYNGEMIYLFGGSRTDKQATCAPSLLQWEMMKKAIENGSRIYNFYGTHPFREAADYGVYNFKKGFRGEIVEYVGTYAKPLNLAGRLLLWRIKAKEYRGVS